MSATHNNSTIPIRYGLGVVAILLAGLVLTRVLGVDFVALLWPMFAAISVCLTLAFLYLFFRLVLAIERIANKL